MFGGGEFIAQNKVLRGAYIKFVSSRRAAGIFSERGRAAIGLALSWGGEELLELEKEGFEKNAQALFGYSHLDPELRPIRELFLGAKTLLLMRLNKNGAKASKTEAGLTVTAKHFGSRGNDLAVSILKLPEERFQIITRLSGEAVDVQTVKSTSEVKDNAFVSFSFSGQTPTAVAAIPLAGGSNGTVTGQAHTEFLAKLEGQDFQVLAYDGNDSTVKELYVSYTKRMRQEAGVKFQTVLFQKAADFEGVINLTTPAKEWAEGLIYFTAGILAGAPVNRSVTGQEYTGEYEVEKEYTLKELEKGITAGEFLYHKAGGRTLVLSDINCLTSFRPEMPADFSHNQIIRVLDQIGKDIAAIFCGRYLGKVQNNADGRISFWAEITSHAQKLQASGAITDFSDSDIVVLAGEEKEAVAVSYQVTPAAAMEKLYMTVQVR